jgi:dihydroorotate dehydrogenase
LYFRGTKTYNLYKSIIRPLFFKFDPEKVHHFTFKLIRFLQSLPGFAALTRKLFVVDDGRLEREVFGIKFPNPVGLAAGFDKDAKLYNELGNYGFGFVEIGTLTPKAQSGNDLPRLFRLPEDSAVINRMGFNNNGVVAAAARLKAEKPQVIIGGNIGKNKITPNERAVNDYLICLRELFPVVDYFVVNVSSPNTPNLRELQEKAPLTDLLKKVQAENKKLGYKPMLLKIAPDLTDGQLDDIIEIAKETKLDGLIATNTTISRQSLKTPENRVSEIGMGGLSGKPVGARSTEVVSYLRKNLGPDFPIIGVGGIFTAEDAKEKLAAGATLVQVYTGFIYEGPGMVKRICEGLLKG